jgi:hypothetical protein
MSQLCKQASAAFVSRAKADRLEVDAWPGGREKVSERKLGMVQQDSLYTPVELVIVQQGMTPEES